MKIFKAVYIRSDQTWPSISYIVAETMIEAISKLENFVEKKIRITSINVLSDSCVV